MNEADEQTPAQTRGEAEEKSAPSAFVVYEAIRLEGEHELKRKTSSLAWSGLAAGLSMGFSFVTMAVLHHHLPDTAWRPLLETFGYSVGFLIVILGRQQLFTENTLTVILPILTETTWRNLGRVLHLWTVVLLANLAGVLLFAFVMAKAQAFDAELHPAFAEIADRAMGHSFSVTVLRGIFGGWLLALTVWLLPAAETARVWVIIILTYALGILRFPHVIAGASEVFYLGWIGTRSWTEVVGGFLFPALIGNTIGGVTLVAALAHAQIVGDQEQANAAP